MAAGSAAAAAAASSAIAGRDGRSRVIPPKKSVSLRSKKASHRTEMGAILREVGLLQKVLQDNLVVERLCCVLIMARIERWDRSVVYRR